jgi:hypothetical protein
MKEKKRRQLTMKERWAQDQGVAFLDPKTKKWKVIGGPDSGKEVDSDISKKYDDIDEV